MKRTLNLLLLLAIGGFVLDAYCQTAQESIAAAYEKATTESKKREIAIKAIDSGLVRLDAPVKVVSDLFKGDFQPDVVRNPDGSGSQHTGFCR